MNNVQAQDTLTLVKTLGYIGAFFVGLGLQPHAFLALGVLMLIDTFLGSLEAIMHRGGEKYTSYKLGAGVLTKGIIFLIPLTIAFMAHGLSIDAEVIVYITMSILILSETYSILGHIYTIKTKKKTTEFDAVAALLGALRGSIEGMILKYIKQVEVNEQKK